MTNFEDLIKLKRPNIKKSSIDNYIKNVTKIYKSIYGNIDMENLEFLKDYGKIKSILEKYKLNSKKAYIASIVVLLDAVKPDEEITKKYRELLIQYINNYNDLNKKQTKSINEEKNWTTIKNLQKTINKYKLEFQNKTTHEEMTNKNIDTLKKWLVGNLYVGDTENPPLRLDYNNMKIVNEKDYNELNENDIKNNNYLINISRNKKIFSIGKYKTDKIYGLKLIPVGKKLNTVINIYLKLMNNPQYLITNKNNTPMNSNALSKFIIKVFEPTGLKINLNLIRHIFISENIKSNGIIEKEKISNNMCHSLSTQELYIKL
jgi:hypothetical protein